jgi:hypothetical protein
VIRFAVRRLFPPAVLALGLAAAACGGDSSSTSNSASGSNAGASQYIDQVCSAANRMFATYTKDFKANSGSLIGMDPTDAYMRIAKGPLTTLIGDMEKIAPPADTTPAHGEAVKRARNLLASFAANDRQAVLALKGTPDTGNWRQVLDLPVELKDRYRATAQGVKSCNDLAQAGGGDLFSK